MRAAQLLPPPRPAIVRPQEVHLHRHGVSTEDAAAIVRAAIEDNPPSGHADPSRFPDVPTLAPGAVVSQRWRHRPHNLIVTVFVNRDAVDWLLFTFQVLSLVGTVAAAWFAYLAIRQAKAQEGQAQKALIHERRLDFELDVLRDLALAVPRLDTASMTGLAVMLPVADIPLTRASLHLTSTPLATRKVELGPDPL